LCMLRWSEEKARGRWLLLAALSAGFAVATKPNGLVAWLLLFFLLAWVSVRETEQGRDRIFSACMLFAVVGALPFLPWLAKNWLQTANLFSPRWAASSTSKLESRATARVTLTWEFLPNASFSMARAGGKSRRYRCGYSSLAATTTPNISMGCWVRV